MDEADSYRISDASSSSEEESHSHSGEELLLTRKEKEAAFASEVLERYEKGKELDSPSFIDSLQLDDADSEIDYVIEKLLGLLETVVPKNYPKTRKDLLQIIDRYSCFRFQWTPVELISLLAIAQLVNPVSKDNPLIFWRFPAIETFDESKIPDHLHTVAPLVHKFHPDSSYLTSIQYLATLKVTQYLKKNPDSLKKIKTVEDFARTLVPLSQVSVAVKPELVLEVLEERKFVRTDKKDSSEVSLHLDITPDDGNGGFAKNFMYLCLMIMTVTGVYTTVSNIFSAL